MEFDMSSHGELNKKPQADLNTKFLGAVHGGADSHGELKKMSQADLNKEFLQAVEVGDVTRARQLLSFRADGNAKAGHDGDSTALHLAAAAEQNSAEMIRLLALEHKIGGDVNCPDSDLSRPLHYAARAGNLETIELLLALGADASARGMFGASPLQFACERGDVACVQALISGHAALDHVDDAGQSLLFYAVMAPTPDVLEYCVAKNLCDVTGAGKHAIASQDDTLLYCAAACGGLRALRLLLELKCDVDVNREASRFMSTPLLAAAARSDLPAEEAVACVEALLAARGDPTVKSHLGENVFHAAVSPCNAVRSGNAALISFLGGRGSGSGGARAMLEERDRYGTTPLHRCLVLQSRDSRCVDCDWS